MLGLWALISALGATDLFGARGELFLVFVEQMGLGGKRNATLILVRTVTLVLALSPSSKP